VTATTVALVLVVAVFFGKPLLEIFGITIASFRVAGGLLLLLMAIAMLHAHPTRAYHTTEQVIQDEGGRHSVAVVPLAVPLVAGPGAVSTVILYSHQATMWFDTVVLVLASLFVALALWFTLRMAGPISRFLGKTGINLVTHLMGLVLAAVAVEFITAGLAELLPGLGVRN
jgi:multiple antibiotic resistance protein